ncbi:Hsp70 family protein [Vibrio nereis]|uniref:Hsp70 family protein n=1 Tax=Vibrio nereis TaxID=693 RepID=UPI00249490E4|nr:Hsp70 family protein [Vibrio nereis]
MKQTTLPIGIDLGTTNSAIAIWRNGQVELIPNSLGELLTPSVVSIDENNTILVGQAAKSRMVTRPRESVSAFKRFLGTDKVFCLSTQTFKASELCAIVLKSLKADAEAYLDETIKDVVISVPAYFSDQQRKEVRLAAEIAGLNAVRLINEPTAACLAYSLHEGQVRRFLVLDLGGGTFDVTVVEYQDSFIEVRASTGDNYLGGEDFSDDLVTAVLERLHKEACDVSLKDLAAIRSVVEQAKINRVGPSITITLPSPFVETLEFSSDQLQALWSKTLSRMTQPLSQALADARLKPELIDDLIFVGGATRLREVQQVATRLLGRFGKCELDPDLVVACGAAVQAACRLRDEAVEELILTDVCPYSLGIEANCGSQRGIFSPIIERNTIIPVSREERYYAIDKQQVDISIYQGERFWARENIFIDKLQVAVPKNKAGEEAVDVRFSYDINGLLEVDVTVVSTGEVQQKVIDRSPSGMTPEELAESCARLAKLKFHPRDAQPNVALIEKLHQLYVEKLSWEREWLQECIINFSNALEYWSDAEIEIARKEIELRLKELGFS